MKIFRKVDLKIENNDFRKIDLKIENNDFRKVNLKIETMFFERQISKSKTMIFNRYISKSKTKIFVYLRQRHTRSRKETALVQTIISEKLSSGYTKIFVFKLCCCIVHVFLMLQTCEDRKMPSSIFVKKRHRSFIMKCKLP